MKIIDLNGRWKLSTRDGRHKVPAALPGDNISALQAASRIPDPYWADNEKSLQWIGREDWTYERTFRVPRGVGLGPLPHGLRHKRRFPSWRNLNRPD